MKSYGTILTASLLILGVCSFTQAQTGGTNTVRVVSKTDKDEALVSMTFDETPLSDVIKAFRDATGANIISSGTNLQQTVSVRLDNVSWQKGLTSILEPYGMQLVEKPAGSGIYLVNLRTVEIPKLTKTFQLTSARVAEVEELFVGVLGTAGKVTSFPSANTIIVTAPEKELNECEMIINSIDAPSQQVYIEARFVEMSASAGKALGLRWDQSLGRGDGDSGITVQPTSDGKPTYSYGELMDTVGGNQQLRSFTGSLNLDNLKIILNALENTDGASIFSNPKVIVANEQKARIDMTKKIPNVEVDYQAASQNGQSESISTKLAIIPGEQEPFVGEAFFSYGISLEVTPRISSSGLITVTIEPIISDLDEYFVPSTSSSIPMSKFPIIDIRRIQTVFSMQSGKTAVIGGLSITSDTKEENGIPFLKDIPWIGPHLFGWKSRVKEQREIVIFVTIGIADPITLEEDVGMPRNAVLSRDVMEGRIKEPYQMNREDLFNIKEPPRVQVKEPESEPEPEAEPAPAPAVQQKTEAQAEKTVEKSPVKKPAEKKPAEIQPLLTN